jgi:hypothetical protein
VSPIGETGRAFQITIYSKLSVGFLFLATVEPIFGFFFGSSFEFAPSGRSRTGTQNAQR